MCGDIHPCPSDHFGPRHCAIGANLLPMVHENMTFGPKWPVKILDDAKFYPDCRGNLSVFVTSMLQETFRVNICTHIVLSRLKSIFLIFNLMHGIMDDVSSIN